MIVIRGYKSRREVRLTDYVYDDAGQVVSYVHEEVDLDKGFLLDDDIRAALETVIGIVDTYQLTDAIVEYNPDDEDEWGDSWSMLEGDKRARDARDMEDAMRVIQDALDMVL